MKSGYPLASIHPLPETEHRFLSTDELLKLVQQADTKGCKNKDGSAILTILDFRNVDHLSRDNLPPLILSNCKTVFLKLDDIRRPDVRRQIPDSGTVVTVTETGNRDIFIQRYLSQFGFSNLQELQFGMRGWLKLRYPIQERD